MIVRILGEGQLRVDSAPQATPATPAEQPQAGESS
jgi:hypothetical protein